MSDALDVLSDMIEFCLSMLGSEPCKCEGEKSDLILCERCRLLKKLGRK